MLNDIKLYLITGELTIDTLYENRDKLKEIYNEFKEKEKTILNHKFFDKFNITSKNPFKFLEWNKIVYDHKIDLKNEINFSNVIDYLNLFIHKETGLYKGYNVNGILGVHTNLIHRYSDEKIYCGTISTNSIYDYMEFAQIKVVNNTIMTRHLNLWSDWVNEK